MITRYYFYSIAIINTRGIITYQGFFRPSIIRILQDICKYQKSPVNLSDVCLDSSHWRLFGKHTQIEKHA